LRVRAGGRKNVRLCHNYAVQNSSVFRYASKVVTVELFTSGNREFQTAGALMPNALDWKLILVAGW